MSSNGKPFSEKPSSQAAKEPAKSYQENPNAQQETEQAILSVPVKNYSDYEIAIESKDDYEDALFGSEDELEQALSESAESKANAPSLSSAKSELENQAIESHSVPIDFSLFLNPESQTEKQTVQLSNQPQKLTISNNGINQSPARKTIPIGEKYQLFKQQLALIAQQIEEEKAAQEQMEAEPEPTPDFNSAFATLSHKLKAKSRELSAKGLAKMGQTKAELEQYFGRTLPERSVPLDFILPIIKNNATSDGGFNESAIEKLFSSKGKNMASLFEIVDRNLEALSKTPLSSSKRIALLNTYAPLLSSKIKALIAMYERKPCNFDDEKRVNMVDYAYSAIKHLITGYKTVYSEYYHLSNLIYGPQRKHINETAFRLMDMLYLEQLLITALHLPAATGTSKTAHKLFYILSLYEPESIHQQHSSLSLEKNSSVVDLFIACQLLQHLVRNNLSSALHRPLKQYLTQYRSLISVIPLAISQRLTPCHPAQQLWISRHDADELSLINSNEPLEPDQNTIYLLVQAFFNQVKQDYVRCLKNRINNKPAILSSLPELSSEQTLLLLSSLNQSIIALEKKTAAPSFSFYQPVKLKAYSSLNTIIAYSHYDYAVKNQGIVKTSQSANNLPELPFASKSVWLCAHADSDDLFLQTTEHKLGTALDIGQLVLFINSALQDQTQNSEASESASTDSNTSSVSLEKPAYLTRITTMERRPQGKLLISAKVLSHHFTAACYLNESQVEKPCLLTVMDQQYSLFADKEEKLFSQQTVPTRFLDESDGQCHIKALTNLMPDSQQFDV